MKRRAAKQVLIPLGLAITIGCQAGKPLAKLIWDASAAFTEMRAMKPDVEELKKQSSAHGQVLAAMQVTQADFLKALKDLQGPVIHTRRDVKAVKSSINQLHQGPVIASPFNPGPFGAR